MMAAVPANEIVLEAVPNVSEGRDAACVEAFGRALAAHGCSLLDVHSDLDHNRSVYTLVGGPQGVADSLVGGARVVVEHIDMRVHEGAHPCVGALDVVPIVYLRSSDRELAEAEALAVANRLGGELDLPVFLYGALAAAEERRERAYFREGGVEAAGARMREGELEPDFGPARLHPTAGATLVTARPPLVAFNVELDSTDLDLAKDVAAQVREAGGGLPGVRAIGVLLTTRAVAQVSTNVHDPLRVPLRDIVAAVSEEAGRRGAHVTGAEIVGLAPEAALDDFPADVPLNGFDPARHVLERRLRLKEPIH
jgi:glutamate formiminotransferase